MRDRNTCEVEDPAASSNGRVDLSLNKLPKFPKSDGGVIFILTHLTLLSYFVLLVSVGRENSHKNSREYQQDYNHSLTELFHHDEAFVPQLASENAI
jgi:hypothetical protein